MRMHKLVVLRILCAALLLASSVAPAQAQEAAVGGPITAADINALRTQAERLDPNGCSSVFRWTDDPIVPGETAVRADHLIELRRAINEMVRGVCPTIHEQVTVAGVLIQNGTGGYRRVEGSVLNSGTTRITGSLLGVRVRFFDGNGTTVAESLDYLYTGNSYTTSLDAQSRHLFSVRVSDNDIRDWNYFQVVAFEADRRSVLCSGCARRHSRQREHVTVEGVHLLNGTGGSRHVRGSVQNTGLTRIVGSLLGVRIRFFDGNDDIITEALDYLYTGNSYTSTLAVQGRHLFSVRVGDDDIRGWDNFQVVAFEDDARSVPCSGCDTRHARQPEQVTFEGVHFMDAADRYSYVEGSVLNSGSTTIVGSLLGVRVRFFTNSVFFAESLDYLYTGNSYTTRLDAQGQHLFSVRIQDSELGGGWDYFQVSFEDDGITLDCVGCDQQYRP